MNIYIAASYSRRLEMQAYAAELKALGHDVTSRWLSGSHDGLDDGTDSVEACARWAREDIEDICAANAMLCFTEPEGVKHGRMRGGRHIEFGIAIALNIAIRIDAARRPKRLIVVGPRENVFYCLSKLEVFETWAECMAALSTAVVNV